MAMAWCALVSLLTFMVLCRAQQGFISINCGINESSTYEHHTGLSYSSDDGFIDTGVNRNLPQSSFLADLINLYQTVRSFPNGTRNCYTLKPVEKGSKYLIRAYFLYGNYDGKYSPPQFDLYLDVNLWKTIISNATGAIYTDIIIVAIKDFISICLVNTNLGTPFISALELRPLQKSMYNASNETQSLVLHNRLDLGSNIATRYPDDHFDLIWSPYMVSKSWRQISTTLSVVTNKYLGFDPPSIAMMTAVKPANEGNRLDIDLSVSNSNLQFHIFSHFAELEQLEPNMTRELEICFGNQCLSRPFRPEYLVRGSAWTITPLSGQIKYCFRVSKTAYSTLPPILNALETYTVLQLSNTPTKTQEAEAMMDVKATYKVKRNWMGDPCIPKDYLWEGLTCDYPDSGFPTIKSLNLSSTGLDGEIALSFANLASIESLDLSENKLSGPIPDFLGDLPSLSLLNLSGNQLNGTLPSNLLERSNKGLLKLSVEDNPNLNISNTRNKQSNSSATNQKSLLVRIVAIVGPIMLLLIGSIIASIFKRRKQDPTAERLNIRKDLMCFENRQFTYAEVVEMTNNNERTIGRGGFGTVYHGKMKDGPQVAVKILNPNAVQLISHSGQDSIEFQNEAQLLMRVHHKNLVPFIGYCQEDGNVALVFEYMAKGNLGSHLSGTNSNSEKLSWSQRLRIALDVAQGLEYLHNGCNPPIIHRDMKTANILLNEKLVAKIGDFGLSKALPKDDEITHVSTGVKGTDGYLDPEYRTSKKLTKKSDVYSFGVVMLELITGRTATELWVSGPEPINIIIQRADPTEKRRNNQYVDPKLEGNYDVESVQKFVKLALKCTARRSTKRPTMSEVLAELKECLGSMRRLRKETRA